MPPTCSHASIDARTTHFGDNVPHTWCTALYCSISHRVMLWMSAVCWYFSATNMLFMHERAGIMWYCSHKSFLLRRTASTVLNSSQRCHRSSSWRGRSDLLELRMLKWNPKERLHIPLRSESTPKITSAQPSLRCQTTDSRAWTPTNNKSFNSSPSGREPAGRRMLS